MRKYLIAAAMLVSGAVAAAPAAAQGYYGHNGYNGHRAAPHIERQLHQLANQIHRAENRNLISNREEDRLLRQVRQIDRRYDRARRNGISQWEMRDLTNRIHHLRQQLRFERREARYERRW